MRTNSAVCLLLLLVMGACNFKPGPSELDRYKDAMISHKSIAYTAKLKRWSSTASDTVLRDVTVVLSKLPGDTILGGKVFIKDENGQGFYDGKDVYYLAKDSIVIKKSLLDEQGIYTILGNISGRAILNDFLDTASWGFNKNFASKCTLDNHMQTCDFFIKDTVKGMETDLQYTFKEHGDFPAKIAWYKKQKGMSSTLELTLTGIKYNVEIENYSGKMMNKGYEVVTTHPSIKFVQLAKGTKPKPIEGKNLQTNRALTPADLSGKIVLVDFWFIGCQGCMAAYPHLVNLRKKYAADKVAIIGVDANDTNEDGVKKFITERGMNYTIVCSPYSVINSYSIQVFPTLYILDKSGAVIYSEIGFNESGFEEKISKIIDSNL